MSLANFLCFHKEAYLPIYSDLVGYLGDKPRQVLVEIENIFTHFVRYSDQREEDGAREENLKRAYNHLVRVTIDCYKILWVEIKNDMVELRNIALEGGMSQADFFVKKQEFKEKTMQARALEMESVGIHPQDCIAAYEEVINLGWDILKNFKDELIQHQTSGWSNVGEDPPASYRAPFCRTSSIDDGVDEL